MLKEAMQFLLDNTGKQVEIEKRGYSTSKLYDIRDPLPETLVFTTLTSLCEYARHILESGSYFFQVTNEGLVEIVFNQLDKWGQKHVIARADLHNYPETFAFDDFLNQEDFIIGLMSQFVSSQMREKLLAVIGNMSNENITNANDDGVTQSVAMKAGVVLKSRAELPNPVMLKPFRTFIELDQPESPFILRVKQQGSGTVPTVALFEADGGAWKLDAIAKAKAFLTKELPAWKIFA